ncbi:MAG: hypothetical protein ACI9R3_005377 [Verrucomicrobiales bacterium]|jgi:hypothetical protein
MTLLRTWMLSIILVPMTVEAQEILFRIEDDDPSITLGQSVAANLNLLRPAP